MSLVPTNSQQLVIRRVNESSVVVYNPIGNQVAIVDAPRRGRQLRRTGTFCSQCGRPFPDNQGEAHSDYFLILDEYNRVSRPASGASTPYRPASASPEPTFASSLSQGYFDRFFRSIGLLGRGSRASVYHVEHMLEGVSIGSYALKKIPVGYNNDWLQKVLAEVNLLRSLHHPNLVRYNHVWLEVTALSDFGPPVPCAYLLQEYCNGGTLEEYVEKHKPLSCDRIRSFILDVARGLEHLHEQGLVHCDLKPSNCLVQNFKGTESVLVSDFGESQLEGSRRVGTGSTGTVEYCAPEVLVKDGVYPPFSKSSDIYSLGMTLYYLCFGALPFSSKWVEDQNVDLLVDEARKFDFDFDRANTNKRKDLMEFKQLLTILLGPSHARPAASEVVQLLDRENTKYERMVAKIPQLDENAMRIVKLVTAYTLTGRALHVSAVLAAIELAFGYSVPLFALHMAVVAASWSLELW